MNTTNTATSFPSISLPLSTALSLLGRDPQLDQRQAMRFLQVGIVAGTTKGQRYAARRTYDFRDLLAYDVGRVLVCSLGVPSPVAARVLAELRRRGYFLEREEAKEIAQLKEEIDHPNKFREVLNQRFGVQLLVYNSPNRLTVNDDGTTTSTPRSKEDFKKEVRIIASKVTNLHKYGERPWPICLLLRRTTFDWQFVTKELPSSLRHPDGLSTRATGDPDPAVLEFAASVCRFPGTQVLNLHLLESALRTRLKRHLDGLDPNDDGAEDESIKIW